MRATHTRPRQIIRPKLQRVGFPHSTTDCIRDALLRQASCCHVYHAYATQADQHQGQAYSQTDLLKAFKSFCIATEEGAGSCHLITSKLLSFWGSQCVVEPQSSSYFDLIRVTENRRVRDIDRPILRALQHECLPEFTCAINSRTRWSFTKPKVSDGLMGNAFQENARNVNCRS